MINNISIIGFSNDIGYIVTNSDIICKSELLKIIDKMYENNVKRIYLKVSNNSILHKINKYINFEKVNNNLFLIN